MKEKIALLVIYNHRFDKNIPLIEKQLSGSWSNIFHIVPFYDGCKDNVIPVYESSLFYSGYIAQAYTHLKKYNFDRFVIMADDMVLNPKLNEDNILEELGLEPNDSFIPIIKELEKGKWPNIAYAECFTLENKGAEVKNILPSKEEAERRFAEKGYNPHPSLSFISAIKHLKFCNFIEMRSLVRALIKIVKHPFGRIPYSYPLVGAISDFCIIDGKSMPKFAQYCGAFAGVHLFIECAVPTALILACSNVKTETSCKYKSCYYWNKNVIEFETNMSFNYQKMIKEFPENRLFVHPVKLSKWKNF